MRSERKLNFETGLVELTEQQTEYLDWLTGGRPEGESHTAFAERLGVTQSTLYRWKKDSSFLKMWEARMIATHAHPDTLSQQLARLNNLAIHGAPAEAIRATDLYWKLVDKMTPTKVEVSGGAALAGMSDEALAAALQAAAVKAVERAAPEDPKVQADRVRADLGMGRVV